MRILAGTSDACRHHLRLASGSGSCASSRTGRTAGIYGFAITPVLQGRGYGRAALSGICRSLMEADVEQVELEVSVVNPSALHVYERCGFEVTGTEDYYLLG